MHWSYCRLVLSHRFNVSQNMFTDCFISTFIPISGNVLLIVYKRTNIYARGHISKNPSILRTYIHFCKMPSVGIDDLSHCTIHKWTRTWVYNLFQNGVWFLICTIGSLLDQYTYIYLYILFILYLIYYIYITSYILYIYIYQWLLSQLLSEAQHF